MANQTMGIIKRTFISFDEETLPRVYKCQVRLHLEYGNVIWNPRFTADMKIVKSLKQRARQTIPSVKDTAYHECLKTYFMILIE